MCTHECPGMSHAAGVQEQTAAATPGRHLGGRVTHRRGKSSKKTLCFHFNSVHRHPYLWARK